MKRRTAFMVSLLVAGAVFFLSSVAAQNPERSEPSVSPAPSSQSPREPEVPPEQKFIELSRTKKLSHRRRPPFRRLRTSTSPPEPSTQTSQAIPQTPPSTTEEPSKSQQSTTSQPPSTTPSEQRQSTKDKRVHFTKIRAQKSHRGQVFTFSFKNPRDNSAKEKQPSQSRIPARFSPVFTNETAKRQGSVPQTETNQPDNLVINSGPPGDVPRVRPSGRALNLSAGAGQTNQISQSQNLEEKTVPVNVDASIAEQPVNFLRPSRPKLKTRPQDAQVDLPEVPALPNQPNQPVRQLQLVIANDAQDLARDSLRQSPRPNRPIKGSRFLANEKPSEDLSPQPPREAADPELQIVNERQGPSGLPPRIRYVKAGFLRSFPNPPRNLEELQPQTPRDFAESTTEALIRDKNPTVRQRLPEQPNLPTRPGSRFLPNAQAFPEDPPLEPIRTGNFAEPIFQTSIMNEEQNTLARENSPPSPNEPFNPGSPRFLPNIPNNPEELPPQRKQEFSNQNLQPVISNEEQGPTQFSSPAPLGLNRPFLSEIPESPREQPPPLRHNFATPVLQSLRENEGQDRPVNENSPRPNRPLNEESLRFLANEREIPSELAHQLARQFAGPALQTLTVNENSPRPNRPLNEGSLRFLPNDREIPSELAHQLERQFAGPTLQTLTVNEGQDRPVNENSPRPNRPLNEGSLRFLANDREIPRELAHQLVRQFARPTLHTLTVNEEQAQSQGRLQERLNRPLNAGSLRFPTNRPEIPIESARQSAREFASPTLQTLTENNEETQPRDRLQERPNRPLNEGSLRFSANRPEIPIELTRQATREFAGPTLTINEEQAQSQGRLQEQPNRPLNAGSLRFSAKNPEIPIEQARQSSREFTSPTLTVNEEQAQLGVRLQERPSRPLNAESLRFSANNRETTPELARQLAREFAGQTLQTLVANEERIQSRDGFQERPNRPLNSESLRFSANNRETPPELTRQSAREFTGPTLQTFAANEERTQSRERFQERPNRPLNAESLRFLANHPEIPPELLQQSAREFASPILQTLTVNNEQTQTRGRSQEQPNRALNAKSFRFDNSDGFPPQPARDFTDHDRQDPERFSSPAPPLHNRPSQPGSLRFTPNNPTLEEQRPPPGRDLLDTNTQNLQLNGRLIYSQSPLADRQTPQIPETSIRPLPANTEPETNTFGSLPERPTNAREPSIQLQSNQQGESINDAPLTNPQPSTPRPTEQPTFTSTAALPARVQHTSQTAISNPGFFNPQTNIPRLIIEFPSPSTPGDSSIRLQLNPSNLPTNSGPAFNSQPNIARAPVERPTSPPSTESSNQSNQETPPEKSGAAINPQSNDPQNPAQLPSVIADPAVHVQPHQQASPANSVPAINTQNNIPRIPVEHPSTQRSAGVSNSFHLNQQVPTNNGLINTQSNTSQLPATAAQPNPQILRTNTGPAIKPLSNTPGPQAQFLPALSKQNVSTTLQASSQIVAPNPQLAISPLSKSLDFTNQLASSSTATRDTPDRVELNSQISALKPRIPLNSPSNSRTGDISVARESSMKSLFNTPVLPVSQGPNTSSQSNDLENRNEIPTTLPPAAREALIANTEPPNNSSSNSQKLSNEFRPTVTEAPSKPNAQAQPVDVRLTINFNSNIPGFPGQPQSTPGPGSAQANASQLSAPTPPPQLPPISPSPTEPPKRLQLQPVNAGQDINSLSVSPSLPINLLPPATSTSDNSQQNFQSRVSFLPTSSPQFNTQPVTQITPSLQSFLQFLNSNAETSVNSQFSNPGRPFELRSSQSPQFPVTQDSLARFQQNSQSLPTNVGPSINSQFNIPGRPFQLQSQQPQPQQTFLARFQPNSRFLPGNVGSINTQFNGFSQFPSPPSPPLQDSPNQATPQVFTTNAGLAVNNLSFSPGLSVELLPPVKNELNTNQQFATTHEQPRANFLINSPGLSAELQPPVISQSPISSQQSQPSPQPPVNLFSSINFQSNRQGIPLNGGRNFPTHLLELLPPIDPRFPQPPPTNAAPNPIDIPKPDVPALVPPPREQLTIPIDIPKPDVPALVPPPREHIDIPIDIPKPHVPALIPPSREHIDIPIDIPKPDVPALVPPPRPNDLARFIPPTPTTFSFNPSNTSFLFPESTSSNQPNSQSQQNPPTSSDNPVLILPKSSSRQLVQARLNNPIAIQDLSKKVGFLPQNQPAPFVSPSETPTTSIPTQTGTDSVHQTADLRAGRVRPLVQEVFSAGIPSQSSTRTDPSQPPITFLRSPVHLGLEPPLLPLSRPPQQSASDEKQVQNNAGESPTNTLTPTVSTTTQTLTPPQRQDFISTSTVGSSEQQTVNIKPRPTPEPAAPVGPTSTPQTLPQPPQEGFIIFQTPTITVTTQSNRPDSPINVTVVTQGGTGFIKPNTNLTAEPVRPANPQTSLFFQSEGSGTSTPRPQQSLVSTTPTINTSTIPNLPGTSAPPNQITLADLSLTARLIPPVNPGFFQNNLTSNPFTPLFNQPFLSSPTRLSNITFIASHGPGTACPKLDLQHTGHRAPQFGGNLLLSPGFYPPDDPPNLCERPQGIEGKKFNWWQILLNHGGEPSTLSRLNEAENVKIPVLTNLCVRPLETEGVPVFYNVTKTDSQTYYREEIAYHRFPEAKNTFLESRGLFVWKQAKSTFDSTAFLVLYTRDDSGFWVQIKKVQCNFNRNAQPNLQCRSVPECLCEGGQKRCTESVPVLTRNFPLRTFRF